jgi:hypothetical protein
MSGSTENPILRVSHHVNEPPERITDDELQAYLRLDRWTALQAIFLLNGKKPRNTDENTVSELQTHFIQDYTYLSQDIYTGSFGIERYVAGARVWVETPLAWCEWATRKSISSYEYLIWYSEPKPSRMACTDFLRLS